MINEFGQQISNYESKGWRWVTLGAVRVLMTNGSHWLVGAKHTGDFTEHTTLDDAMDAYHRISNPYAVTEIEEAAQ